MAANGSMMSEWKLRELMCEIGRRVYAKGFAAANDGNFELVHLSPPEPFALTVFIECWP